jgi:hypothetical protein
MPIVITPTGELIDDQTGRSVPIPSGSSPVDFPMISMDELNAIRTRGGEMARENISANMDMGMDSMMPLRGAGMGTEGMTDLEKVQMLMDMGLDQDTAIEAVAMEKNMPPVDPREFSGQQQAPMQRSTPMPTPTQPPMGALSGVPMGASVPMPMRRPEDLMMRNNPMGQDRTMNPMDRLTPRNAPST